MRPSRITTAARAVAEAIRDARQGAGMTQAELALRTGMSQQTITRLENATKALPSVTTLVRIAVATGNTLAITFDRRKR